MGIPRLKEKLEKVKKAIETRIEPKREDKHTNHPRYPSPKQNRPTIRAESSRALPPPRFSKAS